MEVKQPTHVGKNTDFSSFSPLPFKIDSSEVTPRFLKKEVCILKQLPVVYFFLFQMNFHCTNTGNSLTDIVDEITR